MQLLNFLTNDDTFKDSSIDEVTHDENLRDLSVINDFCLVEKSFEKVKPIPNFVLRLEKFFDLQDKFRSVPNCKTNSSQMKYESINLGTELNPQTVNLGIDCTPAKKTTFIKLFKEFKDVFAWTYDDLKTFNTQVILHIIPIKQE